jgi:hypothetical protein
VSKQTCIKVVVVRCVMRCKCVDQALDYASVNFALSAEEFCSAEDGCVLRMG